MTLPTANTEPNQVSVLLLEPPALSDTVHSGQKQSVLLQEEEELFCSHSRGPGTHGHMVCPCKSPFQETLSYVTLTTACPIL